MKNGEKKNPLQSRGEKKPRKEKRRSKFIKEKPKKEILESSMSIIEDNEPKKKEIILDDYELNRLINGVRLDYNNKDGIYKIYNNNRFIGTGVIEKNKLKRDI